MFARIFEALCIWWFRSTGWTIPKVVPPALKQYVLIVAPHTSNWDFPIGVAARKIMGLNTRYVAKKELFKWPIRGTLLRLGGYPVDRSKKASFVEQVVGFFEEMDDFAITITPEGTRKKVNKWKSGFYHMAMKAQVPIVLVGFDYPSKTLKISDPFTPTGDMESDFENFHDFFRQVTPRYPEKSQYQ